MANWKLEEMIFVTICQKCDSLPVTTPLADLEYPKGVIFTPDIVYCAKCGAQLTVQVRSMSEAEIKKRDKEAEEAEERAKAAMSDESSMQLNYNFDGADDKDTSKS